MKPGQKTLFVVLLVAGLVLLNYLAAQLPVRLDATADHIYTLSGGTRSLLAKITEPITIDFYFSAGAADLRIEEKNYADRVREMLRQYVAGRARQDHGQRDRPRARHPAGGEGDRRRDRAAAGCRPAASRSTSGWSATQADQQKAIPALTPDREQFLEYDLSELIYDVQQLDKKKLGLITSLPLQGVQGNPMMGQQGTPRASTSSPSGRTPSTSVPVEADRDRAAAEARRPRDRPSGEPHPQAPVRHRPVPAQRQAGVPGGRPVLGIFQAPGRPDGDDERAAAQRVQRPAGAPRRLGHRVQPPEDRRRQFAPPPSCKIPMTGASRAIRPGSASTRSNFNSQALADRPAEHHAVRRAGEPQPEAGHRAHLHPAGRRPRPRPANWTAPRSSSPSPTSSPAS